MYPNCAVVRAGSPVENESLVSNICNAIAADRVGSCRTVFGFCVASHLGLCIFTFDGVQSFANSEHFLVEISLLE